MNGLQKLKSGLLKQTPTDKDLVINLCAVMEIVGGYEQLMNMPLPAVTEVIQYLQEKAKAESKAFNRAKSKKK